MNECMWPFKCNDTKKITIDNVLHLKKTTCALQFQYIFTQRFFCEVLNAFCTYRVDKPLFCKIV